MQVGRLLAGEEKGYDFAGFSGRHLLLQPSPAISSEKPPGFWGGGVLVRLSIKCAGQ